MSQEKVERYKAEKANRKKIVKQQKMKKAMLKVLGILIVVAVVGGFCYSLYYKSAAEAASKPVDIKLDALTNYLSDLQAETEAADSAETDADEQENKGAADEAADADKKDTEAANDADKNEESDNGAGTEDSSGEDTGKEAEE